MFNSLIAEDNLCNTVHMAEGGSGSLMLNPHAPLEKISMQVTDSHIWVCALVLSDDRIK